MGHINVITAASAAADDDKRKHMVR